MKASYDFSKARKNPYARSLKPRISAVGAVIIPQHIWAAAGLAPGDIVRFELTGDGIVLRKGTNLRKLAGLIDMSSAGIDAELAEMRGKPCIPRRRTTRAGAAGGLAEVADKIQHGAEWARNIERAYKQRGTITAAEFDKRFAAGEDVTKYLIFGRAKRINRLGKKANIKKGPASRRGGMLPEYDFSQGVRSKYAKLLRQGSKTVVKVPDAAGSLAGIGGKPVPLEKARRKAWGKVIAAFGRR